MRIGGLGSLWPSGTPEVASCGPSPCTWVDNVYARDACVAYMQCAAPNDPTTIGFTQGAAAGVGAEVGQSAANVTTGLFSGLTGAGIPGWAILGALAIGGLVLIQSLKR